MYRSEFEVKRVLYDRIQYEYDIGRGVSYFTADEMHVGILREAGVQRCDQYLCDCSNVIPFSSGKIGANVCKVRDLFCIFIILLAISSIF